jgi:anti-sigma factor RsiW
MSTTPHPIAPEEIMSLFDDELSASRAQSVSAHLESCPDCQAVVTTLRNTSHSLSNWTVSRVPAALDSKVIDASSKSFSNAPFSGSAWSLPSRRWTRKQWIGGLATAAAFLVLVFAATPNLLRSRMAAYQAAARGRQRRELTVKSLPQAGPVNLDEPLADETQGKVFSNQIPPAKLPLESGSSTRNTLVTRSSPGAAADSNGLFHGLGDHVENSFSVDGQPRTDQQSRVFPGPMIARTISLSIVAKGFDAARASLDAILVRRSGYSASLAVNTPQGAARSLQASLRIPAPQLPAAVIELKSLGRVEIETQSGEEVTQPHADLVARLKNAHETEGRIQAMLKERTGNIGDVLAAEQEIARVRGEIERMEAEQKNLEHRVDFVTVDLNLLEEYKAQLEPPAPAISTLIHNAAVNGYRNVADTLLSILLFFAEYGPVLIFWFLVLAIPAAIIWRRWRHVSAAI